MSLLETMHKGRQFEPPRLEIHGSEGIGKSTLASRAPNPAFIPTEDGLGQIACHAFPLARTFEDVTGSLECLLREKHDYQTAVIDTLDWLERLIWAKVCTDRGVKSIEDIGYQKGYVFALDSWRTVLGLLDDLRRQLAREPCRLYVNQRRVVLDELVPKLRLP